MEIRTQDEYQRKQSKRINQKIKVLINRPDFQKDIALLRNRWKVPKSGLKNERENEEWNQQLLADTDNYYDKNWPNERKKLIVLTEKGKYREADELRTKINKQAPLNAFDNDIWVMVITYKLSPRWHDGVKRYLLFNDPKNMAISMGITVLSNWNHGIPEICLQIDKDTTLDDIKRVWSWARKMYRGKEKPHKFQPIKNFERDKEIYQLQQKNKEWKKIAEKISIKYGDELDYNDINIIVKRYKKRLHIN